jgi:predicted DNA-binding transcriptional regulator AlpA
MTMSNAIPHKRMMPERNTMGHGEQWRDREDSRPSLAELVHSPQLAADLPPESILPLLTKLNVLESILTTRVPQIPTIAKENGGVQLNDHLLNPKEAAARLNVTVKWLYRHAKQLPFTKRLSRKALRFSEQGLQRWLTAKRA